MSQENSISNLFHRRITRVTILMAGLMMCIAESAHSQQQFIITQYMFNGLVLNPAYAGNHESWSFTAMSRKQWTGIEGAPQTQTFSMHGPINRRSIAGGFLFVNDKFGAIELNNMYGSFAYKINYDGGKKHLSLGLQGGLSTFFVNLNNAHLMSENDPAINSNNRTSIFPNFGTGIYYSDPKFYAGLSIPYIINNRLNQSSQDLSKQSRHFYFIAGATHPFHHNIKFKPSVLIRYTKNLPIDVDLNSSIIINDIIWLGVTYRMNDSFDFIFEIQFTHDLRLGYSFDLTTSELSQVSNGSHEFVLNYRLKKKHQKVYHPRNF